MVVLLVPALVLVVVAFVPVEVRPSSSRQTTTVREFRALRVCADPNNLPFSNARLEGFENAIAKLLARELNATVQYTWWPQRRGFIRNTLGERSCDLVMGVPTSLDLVRTTRPYYRSTYVFVHRQDRRLALRSFDDPILRRLKIGVQLIGDDYANTPPAHALTKRGIVRNVVGYTVYGDYRLPNPPARIIDAVVRGEVDVAVVWGPLAGYFARQSPVHLEITPVSPQIDVPFLPFVFDIAVGVRRTDDSLAVVLDAALERLRPQIASVLDNYGVPRVRSNRTAESPTRN